MPSFCNAVCVVVTDCLCATRPKLNTHRECATKKSKKKGIPAGAGMYIDRGLSYDIRIIILMTRRHREK